MEKIRVYELARELDTNSKRLMEKLAEIDIIVKNHMSLLEEHELESLYRHIGMKTKTQDAVPSDSGQPPHEPSKTAQGTADAPSGGRDASPAGNLQATAATRGEAATAGGAAAAARPAASASGTAAGRQATSASGAAAARQQPPDAKRQATAANRPAVLAGGTAANRPAVPAGGTAANRPAAPASGTTAGQGAAPAGQRGRRDTAASAGAGAEAKADEAKPAARGARDAKDAAAAPKTSRDTKSAPRIIRTTEINLDRSARDDRRDSSRQTAPGTQQAAGRVGDRGDRGGRGGDRDRRRRDYDRSEYYRAPDSNAGLIAGFTRMTREESMKQLLAEARAQQKLTASTDVAKRGRGAAGDGDAAGAPARGSAKDDAALASEKAARLDRLSRIDASAREGMVGAPDGDSLASTEGAASTGASSAGMPSADGSEDRLSGTAAAISDAADAGLEKAGKGAGAAASALMDDGAVAGAGSDTDTGVLVAGADTAAKAAPETAGKAIAEAAKRSGRSSTQKAMPDAQPQGATGGVETATASDADGAAAAANIGVSVDATDRTPGGADAEVSSGVAGAAGDAGVTGEAGAAAGAASPKGRPSEAQAQPDAAAARQRGTARPEATGRQGAQGRLADADRAPAQRLDPGRAADPNRAAAQRLDPGRTGAPRQPTARPGQPRPADGRSQPRASFDGRPPAGDRQSFDGRPYQPRDGSSRPFQPREGGDRGAYQPRSTGDRQSFDGRPYQPRDGSSRPYQPRGAGDRPYQPRSPGGDRPGFGNRPFQSRDGGSGPRASFDGRPYSPQGGGARQGTAARAGAPATGDRRQGSGGRTRTDFSRPSTYSRSDDAGTQRGEQKRTYSGRDAAKDVKKDLKRDSAKTTPVADAKNRRFRPQVSIIGEKKGVNEFTNDEFIISEFYDSSDESKRSKRQQRQRRPLAKEKYIPPRAILTSVTIAENMTVKELAEALKKTAANVISKLIGLGMSATVNDVLDYDTATLIAAEFGIATEKEIVVNEEDILFDDADMGEDDGLVSRPPVVVVMGHVDHGKTSLLDAIRKTNVISSEAGGITQHIGAYMVNINGRAITFLDTPGHEAFTSMRARGAMVTDIAILVVSAVDGVMPQTVEAINHAKAAKVSLIVAINMIDREGANPDRIKQELTEHEILVEEWGGEVIAVPVSAKTGENIEQLLEMVILTADMLELKANPDRQAKGTVIEAKLDRYRGPVATLLVQRGTLSVGDSFITGATFGRIRAMLDDNGSNIQKAGPSTPVEIIGLSEVPEAGEVFYVTTDDKVTKSLAEKRRQMLREEQLRAASSRITLDDLFSQIQEGKVKELNVIIKADVQGSVEAVRQSVEKLGNDEVRVNIIHSGVGAINESDVSLADVSNAIIIGFNVRPGGASVIEAADIMGIDIRLYTVIYNAIEDIQAALKGMLDPTFREVVLGHVEVRQIFRASGVGTIGGCYVLDGKIQRSNSIRVLRDGVAVFNGRLASLRRFKDDAREVMQGFECGIAIERFNDIKENDIIEPYMMEEIPVV